MDTIFAKVGHNFWLLTVKKNDLVGYIEKEYNLSQDGDCWISGDAKVYGNARVWGFAKIFGDTEIN